ncbi:FecR family protein [Roseivirga sp.]|uniref:FecR family protein n=1 Tax=Roseivirga sp. TaxID=1964215 RepID=UPI003B8C709A
MEDKNVLYHFLRDDCSEEERNQLHTWLANDLDENDANELLLSIWNKTANKAKSSIDKERILEGVKAAVKAQTTESNYEYSEIALAAPKQNKFTSLLAVMSILIIVLAGGYFLTDRNSVNVDQLHVARQIEKTTSKGQRSSILLRDGSKVTLNSETTIIYDDNFGLDNRRIQLNGEAFFEVTKNKNLPFTVTSAHLVTRALGTSFNVRDYVDEEDASIALATGEVKVNRTDVSLKEVKVILTPNEQITVDKTSKEWSKTVFNPDYVLSWKENNLYFNNMHLADIIKTLERWYNVNISVVGEGIEKLKYEGTGKFERQSLENILGSLGYTMGFESSVNEKQIIIHLTN